MGDLKPILDVEFNNVIRTIKSVWKDSPIDRIRFFVESGDTILDINGFYFEITNYGLWCEDFFGGYVWLDENVSVVEAKKIFSDNRQILRPDNHFKRIFMDFSENIVARLTDEVLKAKQAKESDIAYLDIFLKDFGEETYDVSEEFSSKFDVIDFGYRTIEIVSNGNLVLIDKRPEQLEALEEAEREVERKRFWLEHEFLKNLFLNDNKKIKQHKLKSNKIYKNKYIDGFSYKGD